MTPSIRLLIKITLMLFLSCGYFFSFAQKTGKTPTLPIITKLELRKEVGRDSSKIVIDGKEYWMIVPYLKIAWDKIDETSKYTVNFYKGTKIVESIQTENNSYKKSFTPCGVSDFDRIEVVPQNQSYTIKADFNIVISDTPGIYPPGGGILIFKNGRITERFPLTPQKLKEFIKSLNKK